MQQSAGWPRPLDRASGSGRSRQTQIGSPRGKGNHPNSPAQPRSETVAGKKCGWFKKFPRPAKAIAEAIPGQAELDGEIVHLGKDGKPRFYDVMRRRSPQMFYAFDILWHN